MEPPGYLGFFDRLSGLFQLRGEIGQTFSGPLFPFRLVGPVAFRWSPDVQEDEIRSFPLLKKVLQVGHEIVCIFNFEDFETIRTGGKFVPAGRLIVSDNYTSFHHKGVLSP
jgi:hypothetical protein